MLTRLFNQRFWLLGLLISLTGCASLNLPSYIQAENPYKRTYYGSFQEVLEEVRAGIIAEGWQISKEVDPGQYERNPLVADGDKDHILIFSNVRNFQRGIYKKLVQLNVYVNRTAEGVEVDLRYRSVKNFYLFKINSYRNDKAVKKLLDRIEQKLLLKK